MRSGRPAAVLVLALTLVVGLVSDAAHFVLLRHVRCPDHDELIHQADAGAHAEPGRAPVRQIATLSIREAPSDSPESHEHCAFPCLRRERAELGQVAGRRATAGRLRDHHDARARRVAGLRHPPVPTRPEELSSHLRLKRSERSVRPRSSGVVLPLVARP